MLAGGEAYSYSVSICLPSSGRRRCTTPCVQADRERCYPRATQVVCISVQRLCRVLRRKTLPGMRCGVLVPRLLILAHMSEDDICRQEFLTATDFPWPSESSSSCCGPCRTWVYRARPRPDGGSDGWCATLVPHNPEESCAMQRKLWFVILGLLGGALIAGEALRVLDRLVLWTWSPMLMLTLL